MTMNMDKSSKEVWFGRVHVKPRPGSTFLGKDGKGAYINMLAWAANSSELEDEITKALNHYGLDLEEMEDFDPLSERIMYADVHAELIRLAEEVRETGQVRFGKIHIYLEED
jgi:hypothetical protein